jgi:hypothetical protein
MPESWITQDNPGMWIYAPAPAPPFHMSLTAPSPTPLGHYMCRCGKTARARGFDAVKALMTEYRTHRFEAHGDEPPYPLHPPEPAPAPGTGPAPCPDAAETLFDLA